MEGKGVDLLTKAADGSDEARVPPGKATAGQFTVSGDGPSTAPKKPNPFASGKKKTGPGRGGKGGKKKGGTTKPKLTGRAAIRQKIAGLRKKLSGLQAQEKSLEAKLPKQQSSGVGSSPVSSTAQAQTAQSSSSSPSSSRPNDTGGQSPVQKQLAQVRAQIKQVKLQIKNAQAQLAANKSVRNPRDNPTGRFRTFEGESKEASHAFLDGRVGDAVDLLGSARALATEPGHRTTLDQMQRSLSRVQHHVIPTVTKSFIRGDSIAHGDKTGFHEGSAGDGHIYLRGRDNVRYRVPKNEVRAASDTENEDLYREEPDPGLAEPDDEKTAKKGLTRSQSTWFTGSMGENSANKVGPKGYIHGWVKVGAGTASSRGMRKGDTVAAHDGEHTLVGVHDGTRNGRVSVRHPDGSSILVPHEAVRPATPEENIDFINDNWSHADTPEKKRQHQLAFGSSLPSQETYRENVAGQRG
jgi:hypothetical protein